MDTLSTDAVDHDEPRFSCGLTVREHEALRNDPVRRLTELTPVGEYHDDFGSHLQLANHCCDSTLAWPIAGHVNDDGSVCQ